MGAVYGCHVPPTKEGLIEFRVLGPLQVVDSGRVLPLSGLKQRGLLALLLLDRDRLIDSLWRDEPPASAANNRANVGHSRGRRN